MDAVEEVTTTNHVTLFKTHKKEAKNYHSPLTIQLPADLTTLEGAKAGIEALFQSALANIEEGTTTRVTLGGEANVAGKVTPGSKGVRIASVLDTHDVACHPLFRDVLQGFLPNAYEVATGSYPGAPGVAGASTWQGNTDLIAYRANMKAIQAKIDELMGDLEEGTEEYQSQFAEVTEQVRPIYEFASQSLPAIRTAANTWQEKHPEGNLPKDVLELLAD